MDVVVQWMKREYSSSWKPWTLRKGNKVVPWEDTMPKESIILYDFELISKGHLHKKTVEHSKEAYSNIL